MKVTICIGSSCHIKGSRRVVEKFQELISKYELSDVVELGGTFCMGHCQEGVCVTIHRKTLRAFLRRRLNARLLNFKKV